MAMPTTGKQRRCAQGRRWGGSGACLGAGLACFASCTSLLGDDFEVTSAPTGSGAGVSSGGSAGTSSGGQGATSSGGGGHGGGGAAPAPGTPQWAERFGDGAKQELLNVKVDDAGHIWLVGGFAGTMDFGVVTLTALGAQDAFIAELDTDGTPLMAQQFGGAGATATALDVMLTDAGEPVVTGSFAGTINFGGGPHATQSTTDFDAFLLKVDTNGAFQWVRQFGAAGPTQTGVCVARGPSGHIVVGGTFNGSINLGGANLTSAATLALFFGVLDASGNHLASWGFGTQGTQQLNSIAVDNTTGAIFATGTFDTALDFGLQPLTSVDNADIYLVKIDPVTGPVWSRGFGGVGGDGGASVALSPAGDALVWGGWVASAVDFGAPLGPVTFGGPVWDGVVASFSPDTGDAQWSKSTSGAGTEGVSGVAVGSDGQIYCTGVFVGALDLGGGPINSSPGVVDFFLAELNADGSNVFTKRFGGASNQAAWPWPEVAAPPDGGVVLAGWFVGSVDFGLGALQALAGGDVFAAKYY